MERGPLQDKWIVVTGAARRLGRRFAIVCARNGANLVIHYGHSAPEAASLKAEIEKLGRSAHVIGADFTDANQLHRFTRALDGLPSLHALVNSAAIFEDVAFATTDVATWERHLTINLTAPFLLSQAFARVFAEDSGGQIVNILDWRATRPGADHFPYAITKSALAAMTRALAIALAPRIAVNGLALGAVLSPADTTSSRSEVQAVPLRRVAADGEAEAALIFLLSGGYTTGEILHVDGGRHLI